MYDTQTIPTAFFQAIKLSARLGRALIALDCVLSSLRPILARTTTATAPPSTTNTAVHFQVELTSSFGLHPQHRQQRQQLQIKKMSARRMPIMTIGYERFEKAQEIH
jgi:hypothetical protein